MKTTNHYIPSTLLTTNNSKTIKGEKFGWKTYILYMSPHKQNSTGKSICPMATAGCAAACLYTAGHGSMSTVKRGRMNKTEFFLADRKAFLRKLYIEVSQLELLHRLEETKFAVRLNGTSDISWEKFLMEETGLNIFESFPTVQFYDYTKNHLRFTRPFPKNYRVIFSRSETNNDMAFALLEKGVNVAIVFDRIPEKFNGYDVINGDESDLRFLDGKSVIVGLKYKNITGGGADNKAAFTSGFAIRLAA
jgi:hypothetical protein